MDLVKINIASFYKFFLFLWILFIPMKNSIFQVSIVVLLILFLYDIFRKQNYNHLRTFFGCYKDILGGFILIVLSMSISNYLGIQNTKGWYLEAMFILRYGCLLFILFYGCTKNYFTPKTILLICLFSLTLHSLNGLYQHFFDVDFISGHKVIDGAWLTGAVFYYNPFGMLMALGALITLILLISAQKDTQSTLQFSLLVMLLFLFLYTLLFSLSRASWVAFVISIASLFLFDYKKFNKMILFILLCIIFMLVFIMLYNETSVLLRLKQLFEGDSSNRYDIWKATFEAFLKHPYFGYGLDSFKNVVLSQNQYNGVHNSFLEILLYLGLFGLSVFSLMVFLVLREIYRIKKLQYFSIFIFFFTISQFDHSLFSSKIFLSILTLFFFFLFSERINDNHLKS